MKLRAASGITLTLLLIGTLTLAFNIQPVKAEPRTWTVDYDGSADFQTIQEAINVANPGDTIFVKAGIYYEQVVVNKSVSLIGEDEITKTAIITNGTKFTIYISANNVTINGFEIRNSIGGDWGIILNHSSNSIVNGNVVKAVFAIRVEGGSGNNISDNGVVGLPDSCVIDGLEIINSSNNVVTGNYLSYDCHNTLTMYNSNNNSIAFNYISGHFSPFPVTIAKSNNNLIVGNTIWGLGMLEFGHIQFRGSNGNVLYHNSFLAYAGNITMSIDDISMNNTWDDGYPSGGNYWSDYEDKYPDAEEIDGSGIWDKPYVIDANNTDHYPLMNSCVTSPPRPPPSYVLTIYSSPTGVTFTVDGVSRTTPWSGIYSENALLSLVMPGTHDGYAFSHWLEDGDTNRIKTVTMDTDITLTAVFIRPFGGKATPINMPIIKPELQIPWIQLLTIILPLIATVVFVKLKKKKQ